jgi:predicted nucleic acid-binding protein
MIFLQGAARRESPAGLCITLAERGVVELCISSEILSEVADVLARPRIRTKFPALTDEVVAEFVATSTQHFDVLWERAA